MEMIYTAQFDSPIGPLQIASTDKGLAYVQMHQASGRGLLGWQKRHLPQARVSEAYAPNRSAASQLLEYLEGKRLDFDLPLDQRGTAFELNVYAALLEIPYGETRSYAEIAAAIGNPGASRAVGAANAANSLPLVVPCHRVIAAGGKLGGYAGGLALKRRLLAMEQAGAKRGNLQL